MHVKAATSVYNLLGPSIGDTSVKTYTLYFDLNCTDRNLIINGVTYEGTSEGSLDSNSITGSYNGSGTALQYGNASVSMNSSSGRLSGDTTTFRGTVYNSSVTMSGTMTGSISMNSSSGSVSSINQNVSESGTISLSGFSSGLSSDDSGDVDVDYSNLGSCLLHMKVPFQFFVNLNDGDSIEPNEYYGCLHSINIGSVSSTLGTVRNLRLLDYKENLLCNVNSVNTNRNVTYYLGSELLSTTNNQIGFPCYLDFDIYVPTLVSGGACGITFNIYPRFYNVKSEFQSVVGSNVSSDIILHELQEENNAIVEDTNETTHSIFDSISAFFSSFFGNLINSFKSLFIPDDDYFTDWFTSLNDLLTEKLGILYYPFGYLISFLTDFMNLASQYENDNSHCYITFPAIQFPNRATGEMYVFSEEITVDLASFNVAINSNEYVQSINSRFTTLVASIRIFNDVIVIFALFSLSYRKLNVILKGSESD